MITNEKLAFVTFPTYTAAIRIDIIGCDQVGMMGQNGTKLLVIKLLLCVTWESEAYFATIQNMPPDFGA